MQLLLGLWTIKVLESFWVFNNVHINWPDCRAISAFGLMMSVCFSVIHIWLTFEFKFWNLLCNPTMLSLAVSLARLQSNSILWIDDVHLSVCHPHWLTFEFKFWNLLCNPAILSLAVSCFIVWYTSVTVVCVLSKTTHRDHFVWHVSSSHTFCVACKA